MDCAQIKVEMAEGGLLDPLVIVEEGDETKSVTLENSAAAIVESGGGVLKREEEPAGGDRNEAVKARVEKRQSDAEEDLQGEAVVTEEAKEQRDKPEETESTNDGQDGGDSEEEGKTDAAMSRDVNSGPEGVKITQDDPEVDRERLDSSERQPEETKSREEDLKKVCGLFLFYCGTNPPPPPPTSPEIQMTQLADHAVSKVFVCGVLQVGQPASIIYFARKTISAWKEKERKKHSRHHFVTGHVGVDVGVGRILLLCQQTVRATHRVTFPPSLFFLFCLPPTRVFSGSPVNPRLPGGSVRAAVHAAGGPAAQ